MKAFALKPLQVYLPLFHILCNRPKCQDAQSYNCNQTIWKSRVFKINVVQYNICQAYHREKGIPIPKGPTFLFHSSCGIDHVCKGHNTSKAILIWMI